MQQATCAGIGIHNLPENIRQSTVLSDADRSELATVPQIPDVDPSFYDEMVNNIFQYYSLTPDEMEKELHQYAAQLLQQGNVATAWQVLLAL